MKKMLMFCLVCLISLGSAAWSQAQQTGGAEKAVAASEEQWLQSQKTNNPDLVAPLLADKFVETSSDGQVMNKAEALAQAKATNYVSAEYEDVKVTVLEIRPLRRVASKARAPMRRESLWMFMSAGPIHG